MFRYDLFILCTVACNTHPYSVFCLIKLYWVGQASQVNNIVLSSQENIIPTNFKATLQPDGESGTKIVTDAVTLSPDDITEVDLSPTFFNVPVEYLDASTVTKTLNPNFGASIKNLFEAFPSEAVIFSCRSGNRSTIGCYVWYCSEFLDPSLSMGKTFYEVEAWTGDDRTAEVNGRGMFRCENTIVVIIVYETSSDYEVVCALSNRRL